jgi:hypothetical protein
VFAEHNIGANPLPAASLALLPLNEAAQADRAKRVAAACDGGTWMAAG